MLKDLTANIPALSALISALAIVFGGIFSFVRWLDVRKRELDQKRWDDYARLMTLVSGEAKIPVQMAALFQLTEFREYSDITIRALEAANEIEEKMNKSSPWSQHMIPQTQKVISTLKSRNDGWDDPAKLNHDRMS